MPSSSPPPFAERPDLPLAPPEMLPEALAMMEPLVRWMVRSGVGYSNFSQAMKSLFLLAAKKELAQEGGKATDSALSVRSGLHRKDIRAFRLKSESDGLAIATNRSDWGKPGIALQVLTRWLSTHGAPSCLALSAHTAETPGTESQLANDSALLSFEALVREVSRDVHPKTVLLEMQRLGLVEVVDQAVSLINTTGLVPAAGQQETRQLLAGSVADHMAAGVHNLTSQEKQRFLEQSVFANGLSPASIQQLQALANALWSHVLQEVTRVAIPLCEQDADHSHPQRFRLGMFSFSEDEHPQLPKT